MLCPEVLLYIFCAPTHGTATLCETAHETATPGRLIASCDTHKNAHKCSDIDFNHVNLDPETPHFS
jgi:hypothetical protein